ncbi:MAG: hypothetical protein JJ894_16335 [Dinoroseobacter sp.]|nr:hypothetical protein [Dinoroseobacter sp.]
MIGNFIKAFQYARNLEEDDPEIIEAYRDDPHEFLEAFVSATFFKCLIAVVFAVVSVLEIYRLFARAGSLSEIGWGEILTLVVGGAVALFFVYFEPRSFRVVRQFMMVPRERALNIQVSRKHEKSEARVKELEARLAELEANRASDAEEIANLRKTYEAEHQGWQDDLSREETRSDNFEKEIEKLETKTRQLQEELFAKEKDLSQAKTKEQEAQGLVALTKAGADHQIHQAYHSSLDDIPLERVLRYLAEKLSNDDEVEFSHADIATMYGVMHEKFPDNNRVKELALIPHELLRARQIELIVERYSEKITEVEKSDLSEREKRDKINAYRLARERELGIEE